MRGTELIARMKTQLRLASKRAGREVSQENMDRLTSIHRKLISGHDTVDEALRELAAFVAEKSPDDGTNDPPDSSDGYEDNLPPVDGLTEVGIDTADARARSMAAARSRGSTRTQLPSRSQRVPRRSGGPSLYRTGNPHGRAVGDPPVRRR